MPLPRPNQPFIELQRLQKVKQSAPRAADKLGGELVSFFKQVVEKRQGRLGRIADAWQALVEEGLCEHCALESLHRGTLTVVVDSSAHLYQLKQLLLGGVEKRLIAACKSAGLRKVSLKPGRWYEGEDVRARKPKFD
ncbi:MAG TPA: DciA family protein [Tepidisphaeraceae bacterium]|jgi:hypothetical protein